MAKTLEQGEPSLGVQRAKLLADDVAGTFAEPGDCVQVLRFQLDLAGGDCANDAAKRIERLSRVLMSV